MSKRAVILAIVAGLGLAGGAYVWMQFNKQVPSLSTVIPDYSLSADELFDAFDNDEAAALLRYESKVITVVGKVMSMRLTDSTSTMILEASNAMAGGVNCSFASPNITAQTGEVVVVKGRCQGFLMNVILNNCILENEN